MWAIGGFLPAGQNGSASLGALSQMRWADTVGGFQVESAVQMQTISRMRPRSIYDLAL